ncbi:unnamed protein product [Parascedosporium putredinis]|uniref:Pyruvate formate lyase activating enzyme n=1 Tax=Parascedosporium putredinis TaxID=1442378 RepID=A0A9P1H554_9PEZI|nr:unnamed protein product [Parascedosporium putredinis]CAI7998904.1 unnamed protein product [Parascedosporium putredinis]
MDLTPEELGEWYMKLQEVGNVHNINLVTPEHVVPQVVLSILHAAQLGLRVPIVYNTSSFDSLESLELLEGLVDIYLADFKVWEPSTSKRLLKADDYAAAARESIRAMHKQVGDFIMQFLAAEVSRDVFVNIMEQYRPDAHVGKASRTRKGPGAGESGDLGAAQGSARYAEINRAVTKAEVSYVREAAEKAGLWRFCDPPGHDGFNI